MGQWEHKVWARQGTLRKYNVGSTGKRSDDALTPHHPSPLITPDAQLVIMPAVRSIYLQAEISHIVCGVLYCQVISTSMSTDV